MNARPYGMGGRKARFSEQIGRLLCLLSFLSLTNVAWSNEEFQPKEVESALQEWNASLRRVGTGSQLPAMDAFMNGKYRDRGIHHEGGTGSLTVYYLVDDYIQVRAHFDGLGSMTAHAVAEEKCLWLKRPDGTLRIPPGLTEVKRPEALPPKHPKQEESKSASPESLRRPDAP